MLKKLKSQLGIDQHLLFDGKSWHVVSTQKQNNFLTFWGLKIKNCECIFSWANIVLFRKPRKEWNSQKTNYKLTKSHERWDVSSSNDWDQSTPNEAKWK